MKKEELTREKLETYKGRGCIHLGVIYFLLVLYIIIILVSISKDNPSEWGNSLMFFMITLGSFIYIPYILHYQIMEKIELIRLGLCYEEKNYEYVKRGLYNFLYAFLFLGIWILASSMREHAESKAMANVIMLPLLALWIIWMIRGIEKIALDSRYNFDDYLALKKEREEKKREEEKREYNRRKALKSRRDYYQRCERERYAKDNDDGLTDEERKMFEMYLAKKVVDRQRQTKKK